MKLYYLYPHIIRFAFNNVILKYTLTCDLSRMDYSFRNHHLKASNVCRTTVVHTIELEIDRKRYDVIVREKLNGELLIENIGRK